MRLGPVHAGCIMPTHLDIDDLIARMIKLQLPKATLLLMRLCVYIELGVDWVKRNLYILYPNSAQLIQCIDKHVFKLCYCIYIYIPLYSLHTCQYPMPAAVRNSPKTTCEQAILYTICNLSNKEMYFPCLSNFTFFMGLCLSGYKLGFDNFMPQKNCHLRHSFGS